MAQTSRLLPSPAAPSTGSPVAGVAGSFSSVRLYHRGCWTALAPEKMRTLVMDKARVAAGSRAASLRARAELGLLLLFLRYHVVTFRGGHGAWGPALTQMGINYKTAQRAVEAAVMHADKAIVWGGGDGVGGSAAGKAEAVCTSAVLAEAALRAYPAVFTGAVATWERERAAWMSEIVKGRAAARLVSGNKTKAQAVREIARMIDSLPLWTVAAQDRLEKGGMDAVQAARVLKALRVIQEAAEGKQQVGAAVRGALTA